MGWALLTIVDLIEQQGRTEQRVVAAEQELDGYEADRRELQKKIELLNDPEYIQEVARKEYGMIIPGEQPIQVTRPEE
ncbi:FtsB family cell division protein [Paenibacillus sabuli]|nr:septum formation initiator family protein [Paenibacillus sabuli]